ncbi:MAG: class I SAM-dependent methyltransferase [Polyangiaceae bacterium]|nr:class I SAM-dependent methyltransferase [Polyangiaceae bacterium]
MLQLVGEAVTGATRILEVAAGTGLATATLARSAQEVVSTDYAEAMVAMLAARVAEQGLSNVRCEQADLYTLRFEPASFDAVVAANVLHLVPDIRGAITSLQRVLKPGGRLIVPTFCHDETRLSWVVSRALALTGFPGHRRFTHRSLQASLEEAGVQIKRVELLAGLIPIGYIDGVVKS